VSQIVFQQSGTTRMTTGKQYDYLNRLTQISSAPSASSAVSFNYNYNSANQRTNAINADNSYWIYQYDALGQVISGKKYWADGTPVAGEQFTYNFDNIGNRENTASGGDSSGANLRLANYTNNVLNQITSRDVPGYVDVLGSANANATVTVNLQRAYRYNNYFQDELGVNNASAALWLPLTNLAVLNNGTNADIIATNTGNVFVAQEPETFGYDADGNMTNDGRFSYTWDAENRLINLTSLGSAPSGSQVKLDFACDSQGRRIQKIVSTNNGSVYVPQSTNIFVYDGWNLIAEAGAGGSLIRSYIWGLDLSGSMQGAGGVGGLLEEAYYGSSTTNCFVAYDGNGNVAALANAADGTVSANYEYDPFGQVIRATGPMARANPIRFSTKYQDDESGLNYYGYRFYNPSRGRWLSRDPVEEDGGLNLYSIVGNDNIDEADVLGQWKLYDQINGLGFDHTYSLQSMADYILNKAKAQESFFVIANGIADLLPDLGLHVHADSTYEPNKPSLCCVNFDGDTTGVGAKISKLASLDASGKIHLKDCKTYEYKDLKTDGNAHFKIFLGESKSPTEHIKSTELKGGGSLDMELGPTYGEEINGSVVMGVHVESTFTLFLNFSIGSKDILNNSKEFSANGLLQLYPELDYTAK
jgi:RHS repeat-associated protein